MRQLTMIDGTPFDINSRIKDSVFVPGTTGYVSFLQGPDYKNPNIVFLKVVVIRRGVGGKYRLNSNVLLCPIFKSDVIKDTNIMFPKESDDVEYKYLVDLDECYNKALCDVTDKDHMPHSDFMGWLLSKALLLKALDSVVYDAVNEALGITHGKQSKVWKIREESILSEFVYNAESMGAHDDIGHYIETYCTKDKRTRLVSELYEVEAKLAVPKIVYSKRVASVIKTALNYVKESVKSQKNSEAALTKINIKSKENNDYDLDSRLKIIAENRKIMKL